MRVARYHPTYQQAVRQAWEDQEIGKIPAHVPLRVSIDFFVEDIGDTKTKIDRLLATPDVGDLIEGVIQSLVGFAFHDRKQVIVVHGYKRLSPFTQAYITIGEYKDAVERDSGSSHVDGSGSRSKRNGMVSW